MGWATDSRLLFALALAGVALIAVRLVFAEEARLSYRIIFRFLFTIALPLLTFLGTPLIALAFFVQLEGQVWQALIAGWVIATGWLTGTIFAELARRREKEERQRDYHKAIYAEIGNALVSLWDEGASEAYVAATIEKMHADADFVPFIPREEHDHIYNAVVGSIDVLPRQTIDAIVAYYSLAKAIAALADDMRGEGFEALPQERRIAVYSDYADMRRQAFAFGQYALQLIAAFSKGGVNEAERVKRRLNTRDADQSGPSQESE